jgi:hypothetical protein
MNAAITSLPECSRQIGEHWGYREECNKKCGLHTGSATPIFHYTTAAGRVKMLIKLKKPKLHSVIYHSQKANVKSGA